MPEVNNNRGGRTNLDDIKSVLKYFRLSNLWDELDIQPSTNMINIKKKGDQVEGIFHLLNTTLRTRTNLCIFLGKSPEQRALVRQWVDYNLTYIIQNTFQSQKILGVIVISIIF